MKLLVLYYSLYGNTYRMARAVAEGAAVHGTQVSLCRVPETIRPEVIERNERMRNAAILQKSVPVAKVEDLPDYDAFIFGSPTRYGNMSAQMKAFIDQTATLWHQGTLEGRPAGVFTCASTLHGGQESTLLSMIVPLMHLGMLIVGIPFSAVRKLGTGIGSPYGASSLVDVANDRHPSDTDLELARILGGRVAAVAPRAHSLST